MSVRHYAVTLTGTTPLLMHHDNIAWADTMDAWKADASNKAGSKAGDDRSPAWRWLGCLYHDDNVLVMPQDCIGRCFMGGATMVPVPGSKSGKTFKAQSQSGMMTGEATWPLLVSGHPVDVRKLLALQSERVFAEHQRVAEELGFSLYLKRAKVGTSKHVRVRPRFDSWSLAGTLVVWDDQLTASALVQILDYSGRYKGLGDWRPGGKTPGPFGMFSSTCAAIE